MLAAQSVAKTGEEPFGLPCRDVVAHRDSRENEQLLRAHLDRSEVDDLIDAGLGRDGRAEGLDNFLGRRLADDQAARAPRELVRDIDQDRADDPARERVEAMIAGEYGEREAYGGGQQARQCRTVFVKDGAESGIAQLVQEAPGRYAFFSRCLPDLAHGDAEGEGLEIIESPSTAKPTAGAPTSCGCVKRS